MGDGKDLVRRLLRGLEVFAECLGEVDPLVLRVLPVLLVPEVEEDLLAVGQVDQTRVGVPQGEKVSCAMSVSPARVS